MDELEREDFTRLKMVKKKKEEQIKLNELEKEEEKEEEKAAQALLAAEGNGLKKLKIDDSQDSKGVAISNILSAYDETDDSDIVFK